MNAQLQPIDARTAWLAERRKGIGGSDAGAVVGVNPYKTALDVYNDKLQLADEQPDNPAMAWGRALEPVIRQAYSDRTGYSVATPAMLHHPQHAWMLANVDGIADNGRRVLEIKTARTGKDWGEEGSDAIPLVYTMQVQQYMAVTGLSVADVAVLIGGSDFRLYEVPADPDLQRTLIEVEAAFWQRVQERNPPDPVTFAEVRARFGQIAAAGTVEATPAVFGNAVTLQGITEEIAALEQRADACRAELTKALGEHGDTLTYKGQTLATWKLAKAPQRFDAKAFKEASPDLYAQFVKAGTPSRRFILKEIAA